MANYRGPHPAPGYGDLLPGWTLLPFNPMSPSTAIVATVSAANPGQAVRIRGAGELIAGSFPVPQNPILAALGVGDLTPGGFPVPFNPITRQQAMGCGCAGGGCGCAGLGDTTGDSIASWMAQPSPIGSLDNVTFWGLAAAALFLFAEFRGSKFSYRKN